MILRAMVEEASGAPVRSDKYAIVDTLIAKYVNESYPRALEMSNARRLPSAMRTQ